MLMENVTTTLTNESDRKIHFTKWGKNQCSGLGLFKETTRNAEIRIRSKVLRK